MGIKVVKFGGSSLANASQFKKVKSIIEYDNSRVYVVPSAPGKRYDGDTKITDMLYSLQEYAEKNDTAAADKVYKDIKTRYEEIIEELGLDLSLEDEFNTIYKNVMNGASKDYAASRGEYLNGIVLSKYIGYDFLDPVNCIFFNADGSLNSEKTNNTLAKCLSNHETAVIPGFYGSKEGKIKTFSRGGSDITGSIVARAAEAEIYENWTDVSGFLMADPRIIPDAKIIEYITYKELRELSYMGATVLHEDAIFPVRLAGIPINVRNTNAPKDKGTLILESVDDIQSQSNITGIAGKKGFTVITIDKDNMNSEIGFVRKVLSVLEENQINFEHMPTGIDTLSIVTADSEIDGKLNKLVDQITKAVSPDTIEISENMALIATVGQQMNHRIGLAASLFTSLAEAHINIRMIDQGSSEINIIVGVENDDFEKAIRAIYNGIIN